MWQNNDVYMIPMPTWHPLILWSIHMLHSGSGNVRERVKNWLHLDYTPEQGDIYQARKWNKAMQCHQKCTFNFKSSRLGLCSLWSNSQRCFYKDRQNLGTRAQKMATFPNEIHVRDVPNKAAVGLYSYRIKAIRNLYFHLVRWILAASLLKHLNASSKSLLRQSRIFPHLVHDIYFHRRLTAFQTWTHLLGCRGLCSCSLRHDCKGRGNINPSKHQEFIPKKIELQNHRFGFSVFCVQDLSLAFDSWFEPVDA